MVARVALVPPDRRVLSTFDAAGRAVSSRAACAPLADRPDGRVAPDVAPALLALALAVESAGADFRTTSVWRDVAIQAAMRARYDAWVAAGKPAPGSSGFNASTMKADFVASPGYSGHNAGRSIDVTLGVLRFPGVSADRQLDTLWEIARPLGWSPIIKAPTEGVSESWHFDFWGPWSGVRSRLGYEQAAMCAVLDVGFSVWKESTGIRFVQAQLQRAGFNVGRVDGIAGTNTGGGLRASGFALPPNATLRDAAVLGAAIRHVSGLADSAPVRWSPG